MPKRKPKVYVTDTFGYLRMIRDNRTLTTRERAVLFVMATHAGIGGRAHPGTRSLAEETGLDQETARRVLASLTRQGYLEKVESGRGGNHRRSDAYELRVPSGGRYVLGEPPPDSEPVPNLPTAGLDDIGNFPNLQSTVPNLQTTAPNLPTAGTNAFDSNASGRMPLAERDDPPEGGSQNRLRVSRKTRFNVRSQGQEAENRERQRLSLDAYREKLSSGDKSRNWGQLIRRTEASIKELQD